MSFNKRHANYSSGCNWLHNDTQGRTHSSSQILLSARMRRNKTRPLSLAHAEGVRTKIIIRETFSLNNGSQLTCVLSYFPILQNVGEGFRQIFEQRPWGELAISVVGLQVGDDGRSQSFSRRRAWNWHRRASSAAMTLFLGHTVFCEFTTVCLMAQRYIQVRLAWAWLGFPKHNKRSFLFNIPLYIIADVNVPLCVISYVIRFNVCFFGPGQNTRRYIWCQ